MRSIVLQWLVTLLFCLLGGVCLAVGRGLAATWSTNRKAWLLSGIAFSLHALNRLVQNTVGSWAYFAGPGTPVYEQYLLLAPIANHSRTFAMMAYLGALLVLVAWTGADRPRFMGMAVMALLLSMTLGGLFGWMEGSFVRQTHYSAVAILDVFELLLILSMLLVALVADGVDRLLWSILSVYAFSLALSILWTAALVGTGFWWTPAPWHMHAYRSLLTGLMLACAVRRLVLMRRGADVPGLMGSRTLKPASLLG